MSDTLNIVKQGSATASIIAILTANIASCPYPFLVRKVADGGVEFVGVATLEDIIAYDVYPVESGIYRTDEIKLAFPQTTVYTNTKDNIVDDLKALKAAIANETAAGGTSGTDSFSAYGDGPFYFGESYDEGT